MTISKFQNLKYQICTLLHSLLFLKKQSVDMKYICIIPKKKQQDLHVTMFHSVQLLTPHHQSHTTTTTHLLYTFMIIMLPK